MESVTALEALKTFKASNLAIIDKVEVAKLFDINEDNTAYKLLQRLESKDVLQRVKKGLYVVRDNNLSSFQLANVLLEPSYVSLESALAYYGILSQFPFTVTSISTKRSREFHVDKKEFAYAQVKNELYRGYVKDKDFLIARPEKALLDMLYFVSRGSRNLHLDELDLSMVDADLFCDYVQQVEYTPLQALVKERGLC